MLEVTIQTPADVEAEAPALVQWAQKLRIADAQGCTEAANQLKGIKALQKRAEEFFTPMKRNADATKRAILDAERKVTAPLEEAERLAKKAILTYQQEQDRKRLEEQRRLQAEADERARKEREALEKKAEKAKKPETKERYAEAAAQVAAPVIQVAPEVPRVSGIQTRKVWRFRVTDPLKVPREYLVIDEKKLGGYARAMKEAASVPGVEFYCEEELAASGR